LDEALVDRRKTSRKSIAEAVARLEPVAAMEADVSSTIAIRNGPRSAEHPSKPCSWPFS
jgi:hypothetical protein